MDSAAAPTAAAPAKPKLLSMVKFRGYNKLSLPGPGRTHTPLGPQPGMQLSVKVATDPKYLDYLNTIVGQVPGTETFKVNCAFSALYTLGLTSTEQYRKETQVMQPGLFAADRERYGRAVAEVMNYIYLRKHTKMAAGKRVAINPLQSFTFDVTQLYFEDDYDVENPSSPSSVAFQEAALATLKSLIPATATFDTRTLMDKDAMDEDLPLTTVSCPHGTILVFDAEGDKKDIGGGAHVVALMNVDGQLYMYDYQQQYMVPEPFILRTIVLQASEGKFSPTGAPGSKEYEGYGYFKKGTPATLKASKFKLYLYTCNTGETPLFYGGMEKSLGITRRMELMQSIQAKSPTLVKMVKESFRRELYRIIRATPGLKSAIQRHMGMNRTATFKVTKIPKDVRQYLYTLTQQDLPALFRAIADTIVDEDELQIEDEFLPDISFPEAVVRKMAEVRYHYWKLAPAEKEKLVKEAIAKNMASAGGRVAFQADLDILKGMLEPILLQTYTEFMTGLPAEGSIALAAVTAAAAAGGGGMEGGARSSTRRGGRARESK